LPVSFYDGDDVEIYRATALHFMNCQVGWL
jgi:hypothetical protein